MKIATKLRLFGGVVLLFNIWMIGRYKLEGFVVFLLTLGFAAGYEYFVVRSVLRVENLSGIALGSPTPKVADPISASQTVNDEMWKQALEEYESNARRAGLWARLFAEVQGNEALAKANYLAYRAQELHEEFKFALSERKRTEVHLLGEAERAKEIELQREHELAAKGKCPNCNEIILLASKSCTKCTALFEGTSTWKVKPL
jgi:hypothetical protein